MQRRQNLLRLAVKNRALPFQISRPILKPMNYQTTMEAKA
jgi:hypothetical protein